MNARALPRFLESALLAGMGVFMAGFALSDRYWQLLNPKYSWLTFTAGVLVVLVGLAGFLRTQRKARPTEIGALLVFLCTALIALTGPSPFTHGGPAAGGPAEGLADALGDALPAPRGFSGGSLTMEYDPSAQPAPEVDFGGRTFTRLNLAELLAGEDEGWTVAGEGYAVQGALIRTPELDQAGYVAVGRLLVFCCLADAVGVAALVQVDDPEAYRMGDWVNVLAIQEEGDPLPGRTIGIPGAFNVVRSETHHLRAVKVRPASPEGIPFIMEVRNESPFAY